MLSPQEFEAVCEKVAAFHTRPAPGIVIGVAMVDYARETLGPVKGRLNAVSETQACLTDVIQVMTGCTVGNRYLRILKQLGRYALTLYDRDCGRGVRVSCNLDHIDPVATPELYKFFHRTRDKKLQGDPEARRRSGEQIAREFLTVGRGILDLQWVQLVEHGKRPMLPAQACPECGESYLRRDESHQTCDACSGIEAYFQPATFQAPSQD